MPCSSRLKGPKKNRPKAPKTAVDLFGEIPVTQREVNLWLWKVPVWHTGHSPQRKRDAYVRDYDVIEKIRRFKASGALQEVFGDECCPHCRQRLETALLPPEPDLRTKAKVVPLRLAQPSAVEVGARLVKDANDAHG